LIVYNSSYTQNELQEIDQYQKTVILDELQEWRRDTIIPPHLRKTILLLSDDLRLPSGVGHMSKEIVLNSVHHFNWVQVGGAMKHPESGKIIDMNESFKKETHLEDSYVRIYPYSGYGDPDLIRYLIKHENIQMIIHFTDPRQWIWLYQMEHELRQNIPLGFYHIWDDLPAPLYNRNYYESCNSIACISRQTYNIVKQVVDKHNVKIIKNNKED
jgi:hypothetical protein